MFLNLKTCPPAFPFSFLLVFCFCLSASRVQADVGPPNTFSFSWNSGFQNGNVVPDASASGWGDTRTLSALPGPILDVNVTLSLANGFNGDLYGYLMHDNVLVVLLNRIGVSSGNSFGFGNGGMTVTLDDAAAVDIHSVGSLTGPGISGTFQPDGRNISPLSSPALFDLAARQNNGSPLALLNGLDPSGDWTLYLADFSSGYQTTVTSWGLQLVVVPEPGTLSLLAVGGILALLRRRHLNR